MRDTEAKKGKVKSAHYACASNSCQSKRVREFNDKMQIPPGDISHAKLICILMPGPNLLGPQIYKQGDAASKEKVPRRKRSKSASEIIKSPDLRLRLVSGRCLFRSTYMTPRGVGGRAGIESSCVCVYTINE
jgi:hypothetical protein